MVLINVSFTTSSNFMSPLMTEPHSGPKEVIDSAKWTEGDFSLVSADGVRFRVPSRALFVARYVARHSTLTGSEVLATAGQSVGWDLLEWDFADPQLESAAVLDRFLELVVNGNLIRLSHHDPVDMGPCHRYLHLLNFLKKYKCTLALRLFELCAHEYLVQGGMPSRTVFVLGAALDNPGLCAAALQRFCTDDIEKRLHSKVHELCGADPGLVSDELWEHLPPHYARAWVVAWAEGKGVQDHNTDRAHTLGGVVLHFVNRLSKT